MAGEGDAERLVVLLEARIRDFEKNMAKASGAATRDFNKMRASSQSATRQMESDMVRATTRINQALASSSTQVGAFSRSMAVGALAAIAPLLSLRAAINGTKDALEAFGNIADQSTAAGLDSEFFQGLAHQAKLGGVEIEALAGSLATFNRNSGLADAGTGRMVTALQKLNPELLDNIRAATTQEERVRLAADAIANAGSASEKAALSVALFGDAGAKLADVFSGGSAAIDAMQAKAQALGIIVERDLIARADQLGDEFDTTTQIVDLRLKKALVNLGPALVGLSGLAADFSGALAIVLDQFNAIEDRNFIRPLQNQLANLHNARFALKDEIASLEKQDWGLGEALGMRENVLGQKREEFERMTAEAMKLLDRITELQGRNSTITPAAPADLPVLPDAPLPGVPEIDETIAAMDRLEERGRALSDSMRDPFEMLQVELDELGSLLNAKAIDWDTFAEAANRAKANTVANIAGMASQATGILAGMFEDNKAFAAANAVVSGIEGVAKTLSAYPAPWSFAMAGLQAAAAAAQVSAIMSSNKDSRTIPSVGGGSSAGAAAPPAAPATQGPSRSANITIVGKGGFSAESVRDLVEQIDDFFADSSNGGGSRMISVRSA